MTSLLRRKRPTTAPSTSPAKATDQGGRTASRGVYPRGLVALSSLAIVLLGLCLVSGRGGRGGSVPRPVRRCARPSAGGAAAASAACGQHGENADCSGIHPAEGRSQGCLRFAAESQDHRPTQQQYRGLQGRLPAAMRPGPGRLSAAVLGIEDLHLDGLGGSRTGRSTLKTSSWSVTATAAGRWCNACSRRPSSSSPSPSCLTRWGSIRRGSASTRWAPIGRAIARRTGASRSP